MALNDRMKNRYRRIIRVLMVVLAAVLLLLGFGVPVANNALAMGVAKHVASLPLPADTMVVETASLAGRITNPRGSMQYVGAVLLKSDRSLEELQAHFRQYDTDIWQRHRVCSMPNNIMTIHGDFTLTFRESVDESGYYAVYDICTGGHALQWWLDMDTRG